MMIQRESNDEHQFSFVESLKPHTRFICAVHGDIGVDVGEPFRETMVVSVEGKVTLFCIRCIRDLLLAKLTPVEGIPIESERQ